MLRSPQAFEIALWVLEVDDVVLSFIRLHQRSDLSSVGFVSAASQLGLIKAHSGMFTSTHHWLILPEEVSCSFLAGQEEQIQFTC